MSTTRSAPRSLHRPSQRLVPRKPRGPMPDHDLFSQPREPETIDERFVAWIGQHPEVYAAVVRMAREARSRGHRRVSMKLLWEGLRWERFVESDGSPEYLLNNNYTSRMARLVMDQEPDLRGFFAVRELKSA